MVVWEGGQISTKFVDQLNPSPSFPKPLPQSSFPQPSTRAYPGQHTQFYQPSWDPQDPYSSYTSSLHTSLNAYETDLQTALALSSTTEPSLKVQIEGLLSKDPIDMTKLKECQIKVQERIGRLGWGEGEEEMLTELININDSVLKVLKSSVPPSPSPRRTSSQTLSKTPEEQILPLCSSLRRKYNEENCLVLLALVQSLSGNERHSNLIRNGVLSSISKNVTGQIHRICLLGLEVCKTLEEGCDCWEILREEVEMEYKSVALENYVGLCVKLFENGPAKSKVAAVKQRSLSKEFRNPKEFHDQNHSIPLLVDLLESLLSNSPTHPCILKCLARLCSIDTVPSLLIQVNLLNLLCPSLKPSPPSNPPTPTSKLTMSHTLKIINAIVSTDNPNYNLNSVKGFIKRQINDCEIFDRVVEYCNEFGEGEEYFYGDDEGDCWKVMYKMVCINRKVIKESHIQILINSLSKSLLTSDLKTSSLQFLYILSTINELLKTSTHISPVVKSGGVSVIVTSLKEMLKNYNQSSDLELKLEEYDHFIGEGVNCLEQIVEDSNFKSAVTNAGGIDVCVEVLDRSINRGYEGISFFECLLEVQEEEEEERWVQEIYERLKVTGGVEKILEMAKDNDVAVKVLSKVSKLCWKIEGVRGGWERMLMKFYVDCFKENRLSISVLEGVKYLSFLEPVKVEIVEYLLPSLLRAKNNCNAEEKSVINSILINLGFTDSDINGVGGDAGVVREWFFMERGVVMLSMCREEIKRAIYQRWGGGVRGVSNSFNELDQQHPGSPTNPQQPITRTHTSSSTESNSTIPPLPSMIDRSTSESPPSSPRTSTPKPHRSTLAPPSLQDDLAELETLKRMFVNLEKDDPPLTEICQKIIKEYQMIYGSSSNLLHERKLSEGNLVTDMVGGVKDFIGGKGVGDVLTNLSKKGWEDESASSMLRNFGKHNCIGTQTIKNALQNSPAVPAFLRAFSRKITEENQEGSKKLAVQSIAGWVLSHSEALKATPNSSSSSSAQQTTDTIIPLPARVNKILDHHYPSPLLLRHVLPLGSQFNPEDGLWLRALMMPERRYFSFRREGKVISRVMEKMGGEGERKWALAFRNSSFAGEFAETLLHSLYRHHNIEHLSFTGDRTHGEESSTLLSYLVGSLPESIRSVTFDGVLTAKTFEAMEILMRRGGVKAAKAHKVLGNSTTGTLTGFAIINSPYLPPETFNPLFELLGGGTLKIDVFNYNIRELEKSLSSSGFLDEDATTPNPRSPSPPNPPPLQFPPNSPPLGSPLGSPQSPHHHAASAVLNLTWLDLSGNGLPDFVCARILSVALLSPLCHLVSLNLAKNNIGKGREFVNVIEKYRDYRVSLNAAAATNNEENQNHNDTSHSIYADKTNTSPLRYLNLASNSLKKSATISIIDCINADFGLELSFFSVADNALNDSKDFKNVLRALLGRRTGLSELDLSKNSFNADTLNSILFGLLENASGESEMCVLKLEDNTPPLSKQDENEINGAMMRARSSKISMWLLGGMDLEKNKSGDGLSPLKDEEQNQNYNTSTTTTTIVEEKDTDLPMATAVAVTSPPAPPGGPDRSITTAEVQDHFGQEQTGGETTVRQRRSTSEPIPVTKPPALPANEADHETNGNPNPDGLPPKAPTLSKNPSEDGLQNPNSLTVLFSAPLVWKDKYENFRAIEMLDFEKEREIICQCFREASRDIDLKFDTATTSRLRTSFTLGCKAVHYSGHGHRSFLTFEDGKGGLHWISPEELKQLCGAGSSEEGRVQFVFVSACYSRVAGQAFIEAGVNHVVCCQQDLLQDSAALAFTREFYLALAVGRTVKSSFEIGRQAVAASPSVPNSADEMEKFILLPEDGNHDVRIFEAKPIPSGNWRQREGGGGKERRNVSSMRDSWARGGRMGSSGKGMSSLPSPPEDFIGRERELYHILDAVLNRRLVCVVGQAGVGRSSIVTSLAAYIQERKNTTGIETIFFVRAAQRFGAGKGMSYVKRLYKQVVKAGWIEEFEGGKETDEEDLIETLFGVFRGLTSNRRVLLIFDHIDEEREGGDFEFRLFLTQLFHETRYVKVLVTARREIGLKGGGAGEFVFTLPPLTLRNSVRLFARLCPHVHTGADRRELVKALVDDDQANMTIQQDVTEKTMDILLKLGEGYPNRLLETAYSMELESFHELLKLGRADKRRMSGGRGAGGVEVELELDNHTGGEGEIGIGGLPVVGGMLDFSDSDTDSIG
ncbi:hypothetical protein TrLO_g2216 [Triparma laevis f. longispina]|nr:hypothetical protein TrLO_g2216 [Triparma laevis f. longispina]